MDVIACLSADEALDLVRLTRASTRGAVAERSIARFVVLGLASRVRGPERATLTKDGRDVVKELRQCALAS